MILLAVDPSIRSLGAALFRDGTLTACTKVRGCVVGGADRVHRARLIALEVSEWIRTTPRHRLGPDRIVVEWPQVYRAGKSKGDPNDLLGLAGVCAAVAALFPSAEVTSYLPDEWAPCPKVSLERRRRKLGPIDSEAFTSPRGLRVMGRLSPAERALVPMSHDAVDSVGLGLHHLGRLAPLKVYPGATPG